MITIRITKIAHVAIIFSLSIIFFISCSKFSNKQMNAMNYPVLTESNSLISRNFPSKRTPKNKFKNSPNAISTRIY